MAEVIPFPRRPEPPEEEFDIDPLTAMDAAIRDLQDILRRWGEEGSRRQAEECRSMLERAYCAAVTAALSEA